MHYENYARQAISHNHDIGDSVTHWRRSFNKISTYLHCPLSYWRNMYLYKTVLLLKCLCISELSIFGQLHWCSGCIFVLNNFRLACIGCRLFMWLVDKAGGHLTGGKGRKHSKSAYIFYFTVLSSLWAIKCLSMPIFRFKHSEHSLAPPVFNLKMLSDNAYLYPWPYALFSMRL